MQAFNVKILHFAMEMRCPWEVAQKYMELAYGNYTMAREIFNEDREMVELNQHHSIGHPIMRRLHAAEYFRRYRQAAADTITIAHPMSSILDSTESSSYESSTTHQDSYITTIYYYSFGWLINSVYNTCWGLLSFFGRILWGRSDNTDLVDTSQQPDVELSRAYTHFIEHFEQKYGKKHVNFTKDTLSATIEESFKEKKPVLIFLHDITNVNSQFYCRDLFANVATINLLNSHFIIWAVDNTLKRAKRVSNMFPVRPSTLNVLYHDDSPSTVTFLSTFNNPAQEDFTTFMDRCTDRGVFKKFPGTTYKKYSSTVFKPILASRFKASESSIGAAHLIKQQNEDYEQLIELQTKKQNVLQKVEERVQQKLETIYQLKGEMMERVKKSQQEYHELSPSELEEADPSQLIHLRIYYPNRKSTEVRCMKKDPIKKIVDHIFISNPDISKKFYLTLPLKKHEFFTYGDNEEVPCEDCSIDFSYRITLSYISSDEEESSGDEQTPPLGTTFPC